MKEIDKIKERCALLGVTLEHVLREAKVPDDTKRNWRKKNPKPFETRNKINAVLDEIQQKAKEAGKEIG